MRMADFSGEPETEPGELELTARLARDLIRIDSSNFGEGRSHGETEAAEYVAAELRALGLQAKLYNAAPSRTSVFARVPGKNHAKPALVVHGHLDVVPAEPADWSVDPFGGVIRDGCLWGRGAVDMKNMDAMILAAIGDILRSGELPERELIVGFFSDEESGGAFGSGYLVEHHPEIFAGATEAISEVGGYSITVAGKRGYLLQTGEKTLLWIKLVASGTAAHGSRVVGDNAVLKLAEAVAKIGVKRWPIELTPTTWALIEQLAGLLGKSANDPDAILDAMGHAEGFLRSSFRTTSNPTGLSAGYKHNVIPERAEARIDVRTLPGQEDRVLAEIQELVGAEIAIEIVTSDVGLENPIQAPILDQMRASLLSADPGAFIAPYLLGGGTDNKALSRLGIRGYGFAPLQLPAEMDFAAMFHGVDERVPLDALSFGRRVLGDFLRNY